MTDLFAKRRQLFGQTCLRYLRYVLNDHFVLALLFLSGFLMVQYSQLLANFPQQIWPLVLIFALLNLTGLFVGTIATYLEPADKIFLLVKEVELVDHIRQSGRRAFALWGSLQILVNLLFLPIYLKMGLAIWQLAILLVLLLLIKWWVFQRKLGKILTATGLDWNQAIQQEQGRKQAILKFFSLFTRVKGISTRVKRRAYLDVLVRKIPQSSSKVWTNLYLRAFLRSGDYLALSLRLLGLSLLSLVFVPQPFLAAGLALLFSYLLLFQLLALYKHFDYQYLTRLFPTPLETKKTNLLVCLRVIGGALVLPQLLLVLNWQGLLVLLLGNLGLLYIYLPYKLKQLIDEV